MKTAKVHRYKIIVEKGEDGFFIARVPALPGCVTQAKTYETLLERAREAIQLCAEVAKRDREYRAQQEVSHEPTFFGVAEVAV